jgi:hypothetical protein
MAKSWSPYRQIVIETYYGNGRVRARPVKGEFYPETMSVECSRDMRKRFPIGTRFLIYAKETDREGSPPFLYTHYSWPYEIVQESE